MPSSVDEFSFPEAPCGKPREARQKWGEGSVSDQVRKKSPPPAVVVEGVFAPELLGGRKPRHSKVRKEHGTRCLPFLVW